jgi:hypothetical protein
MHIEAWRLPTKAEMQAYIESLRNRKERKPSVLAVRQHLSPLDMYCYLKARFGKPNGFQTFLRRDDSDNWIHWDFLLKAGVHDINISSTSREIHLVITERLTDDDWRDLISNIKADYKRVGKEKSAVLKSLEKWVVFPNKFFAIANLCADLHARILNNVGGFKSYRPTHSQRKGEHTKILKQIARRASRVNNACLELSLLTPVMAEAFINMVILILCKEEIRDNQRQLESFIRQDIDAKIFNIPYMCVKFCKPIDQNAESYKNFKRVMDKRNHAIHGNIDPIREQVEEVYFQGKIPLFKQPGDHIGLFFETLEQQYQPKAVIKDYEDTYAFLLEIVDCLEPDMTEPFWQIMADRYPGYDVGRQITGSLFPNYVATGYIEGIRYDDELAVTW